MLRAAVGCLAILVSLSGTAQAQVKLEFKFPESYVATTKVATKTHQVLTLMGQDIETNAEEMVTVALTTGKRGAEGDLPVTETVEAIKMQMSLPGGLEIAFDSTNPAVSKADLPQLAFIPDLLKFLVGSSYVVVVDKDGKAKAVDGVDKLLAKSKDKGEQLAEALKGRLDAEKIKKAFNQARDLFPTILVKKGEPWDKTEARDIGSGQTLTFKNRYEYQGTVEKGGKTLDKVTGSSSAVTLTVDDDGKGQAKVTKSDLKVDSSEITILFDRETGQVAERTSKVHITGDITLDLMGNEIPGKLDLNLDTESSQGPKAK